MPLTLMVDHRARLVSFMAAFTRLPTGLIDLVAFYEFFVRVFLIFLAHKLRLTDMTQKQ